MCCAFTSTISNWPSKMFHTGFQYTPVDSSATCVTPHARSQSARLSSSTVNVPKRRFSFRTAPLASAHNTQAVMLFLWTSNPQQQGYKTSIVVSLTARCSTLAKNENLLRVLSATSGGHHLLCLYSVRAILLRGLVGARVARPRSHRTVAKHDTPISRPFHPSLWACKDHELLVSQCDQRIDSRRPARGNVRRCQRYGQQQQRHRHVRSGVHRAYLVQLGGKNTAQGQSTRDADADPEGSHSHSLADHHSHDVSPLSPEGHADADLVRPLAYGIGDHSIDTHGREQQR